jgi:putative transposase
MPIKRPVLKNDEIYHVVIRGTGDSVIFKDKDDYYRGVFSLFEFNDKHGVLIRERRRHRLEAKARGEQDFTAKREKLVEILAFCFMPNHIHLLLRQIKDNGITDFMRKLGAGYGRYFNEKYGRQGHLFQGRFRVIHIKNEEQLRSVFVYIHANPISLIEPGWKEKGIKNPKRVVRFLENYKWSSYQDYIGKKNFPSVTERAFFSEFFGGENYCKNAVNEWIKYKSQFRGFDDVVLE